jgi:hypothetical protein
MSHKIAPNSLDFSGDPSVTIPVKLGKAMAKPVFNDAIVGCLIEIHSRLSEAAQIAKAAEASASAGSIGRRFRLDGHRAANLRSRTFA